MPTDEQLEVDDHLFYLTGRGIYDFGSASELAIAGMVSDFDGTLAIQTGIVAGPVRIHAELIEREPSEREGNGGESSTAHLVTRGPIYFYGSYGETFQPAAYGRLKPGAYGVRIVGTGRDVAYDEVVEAPVEDYYVAIWPLTGKTQFLALIGDRDRNPRPRVPGAWSSDYRGPTAGRS